MKSLMQFVKFLRNKTVGAFLAFAKRLRHSTCALVVFLTVLLGSYGCTSTPTIQTRLVEPPAVLLQDCQDAPLEGDTYRYVVLQDKHRQTALEKCTKDKQDLRQFFTEAKKIYETPR